MDTPGPPARRPSEHAHLWLIYLAAGGMAMIAYAVAAATHTGCACGQGASATERLQDHDAARLTPQRPWR